MINKLNEICPFYKNGTSNRELRHDFFKNIETEIQAYLLGFIMSDGSVNEKRHTLTININKQDEEIFEFFKIISPEAHIGKQKVYESIATVRGRSVKNNGSVRISISSKVLVDDLKQFGIVQNKTYNELHIPNINPELLRHFIRGYFDGDGCITGYIAYPKPVELQTTKDIKKPSVRMSMQIDAKTSSLVLDIQKTLMTFDINTNINYLKRDDMYRVCTASKKEIAKIFKYFYIDANFYLSRKFTKFNYYVNTEVSQLIADHRNA